MDSYEWIMYAGMVVWIGLGAYVSLLACRQNRLSRRLDQMICLEKEEQ